MKGFFAVFRLRFKMELQYRGAMIGGLLCQIVFGLILIALYRGMYASRPQTAPLSSVVTYVWLQQAFFRMLLSSDADLSDKVRSGAIAYDMCRPINLYGFYYSRILAMKLTGSLMRAVPMLIFALLLPEGWHFSGPVSFPLLTLSCLSLLLGLLCVTALENISMGITMRTIDPRGVSAILSMLMMTFSGNVLPLTLFPDGWQKILSYLPYSQLLDAPIRLYTGAFTISDAGRVFAVQAAWTALFLMTGNQIWNRNQRHMTIQGG